MNTENQKSIGTLILGCVENGEYTENDIEIDYGVLEELQHKLVENGCNVVLKLYVVQEKKTDAMIKKNGGCDANV